MASKPTGRPRGRPRKHPLPEQPTGAAATSVTGATPASQADMLQRVITVEKAVRARAHQPLSDDSLKVLRAGNRTLTSPRARRVLLSRILDASLTGRLDWHRVNSAIAIVRAAGECNDVEGQRADIAELMRFRDEVLRGRIGKQDGERLDLSEQVAAAAAAAVIPAGDPSTSRDGSN